MSKEEFIERILPLQSEIQLAIFKDDFNEIERLSFRIGKLITRYLGERKLYVDKNGNS